MELIASIWILDILFAKKVFVGLELLSRFAIGELAMLIEVGNARLSFEKVLAASDR